MLEVEIIKRTEPITFEEICDFIDATSISEKDKYALKSMVAELSEELNSLRRWKFDVTKSLCKYDCNSVDEVVDHTYIKALDDIVRTAGITKQKIQEGKIHYDRRRLLL